MPWIDESVFAGLNPAGGADNPLVSAADLAEWLSIASPTPPQQARLQTATEVATGYVNAAIGYSVFPVAADTATLDGPGWRDCSIYLPSPPVTAVSSIVNDGITLDPTAYDWTSEGEIRALYGTVWTWKNRGIVVTYDHGWNPIPRGIIGVCQAIAARVYQNGAGQPVQQEILGAHSITYASLTTTLTPDEQEILDAYRGLMLR